jgi:hypothetical protein
MLKDEGKKKSKTGPKYAEFCQNDDVKTRWGGGDGLQTKVKNTASD